jgi:hypothetical protein
VVGEKATKRGLGFFMIEFFSRRSAPVSLLALSALMILSLSLPLCAETLRGPGGLPPGLVAAMLGRMKGKALDARGCARLGDLRGCFGAGGAKFRGAGKEVELRAVAWGREGKLERLRWKSVGRKGDREVYRGRGIEAWWRAVPLGYEEGFELLRRPQGRGPVEVELEANRVGRKVGEGVRWGEVRYGKLWVTDRRGRRVPAELRAEGRKIWIRIEGRGWKYPLRVDPLVWIEQAASLPTGLGSNGQFGYSVALSSNGDEAIVGADSANNNVGAAYIYTYDSNTGIWGSPVSLTVPSGASVLGYSVALSSDGTLALVGAPGNFTAPFPTGAGEAYVYTYSGGSWSAPVTLTVPSNLASNSGFGASVALSGNGEVALIGASQADTAGEAYVYTYSGGSWSSPITLALPSNLAFGSEFGFSASLSSDGTVAIVGAPHTDNAEGAAYVYTYDTTTGTWGSPVALTVPSGTSGFGSSAALSSDGAVALVGASTSDTGGAAYVYTYDTTTGTWSSTPVTLSAPNGAAAFGASVSLSSGGTVAIVGAPFTDNDEGAAYVYNSSTEPWTSTSTSGPVALFPYSSGEAELGQSVALSGDGEMALVGAPATNGGTGAAYFYGSADLDLIFATPSAVTPGEQYAEQAILTNNSAHVGPDVTVDLPIPAGATYQSVSSTQGSCTTSSSSGVVSSVSCDVGSLVASGGTATASVTLSVPSNTTVGTEITETSNVANSTPVLSAQEPTSVVNAPTISSLTNETVTVGAAVPSESFTIGGLGILTVTASSSNPTLLPDQGTTVSSGCDTNGASCTLTLSPASGQVGTTTVTVTVENGYGQVASASFALTVQSSVPVVSGLEDVSMTVGSPAAVEDFTVSGVGPLSVETETTNAALLPEGFIEVSPGCGTGSGEVVDRCTLTLSPTAGMTGEASVLVTVTDAGGQTATGLVTLYVEPSLGSTSGGTSGGGSVGVGMLLGLLVLVVFRRRLGGRRG